MVGDTFLSTHRGDSLIFFLWHQDRQVAGNWSIFTIFVNRLNYLVGTPEIRDVSHTTQHFLMPKGLMYLLNCIPSHKKPGYQRIRLWSLKQC